jgi:hypothetical protein
MQIAAAPNCRIQSLAPGGEAGNWDPAARDGRWVVPLEGYQLAAVAVIGGRVVEGKATVELDTSAGRELELATAGLTERLARLDSPPMYERLANPSFEAPNQQGRIASWIVSPSKPGVEIGVESRSAADGAAAMRAASSGATCFVVSDWFEAPETGRLAVYVALRTDDAKSQPPLRVGIESRVEGNLEYRWTPVGAAPAKAPLGAEWGQFIFPFDDLPVSADTQLRICFDLVGSGVVHIDDVKTSALYFDPNELRTLSKTVATARFQAQARQWADCADILEGYWPRFLMEHVAPEAPREARAVKPPAVDESATPGVLDRIKQFRPF